MQNTSQKNEIFKKNLLWFIFLMSNTLILIGVSMSWILADYLNNIKQMTCLTIFCAISIVSATTYYFLETKELVILKMHSQKKWFNLFMYSIIPYSSSIIIISIYQWIMTVLLPSKNIILNCFFIYGIEVAITVLLTLTTIIMVAIARTKIAFDVYKKRYVDEQKKDNAIAK